MPAQILPMLDTVHDQLASQAQQQQQAYQQQLLNLQSTKQNFDMQQEQALAPLRQQALQAEIARSNQGMQSAAWALKNSQDMAPSVAEQQSAETEGSKARTALAQNQLSELTGSAADRAKIRQNEIAQGAIGQQLSQQQIEQSKAATEHLKQTTVFDLENHSLATTHSDLENKLLQQNLDNNPQAKELAQRQSAANLTYLALPVKQRNAIFDDQLRSGSISQATHDQYTALPDQSKDMTVAIQDRLGPDAGAQYRESHRLLEIAVTHDNPETITQALAQIGEITHKYILQGEMDNNFINAQPIPDDKKLSPNTVYNRPGQGPMRWALDPETKQYGWVDPKNRKYWQ